MILINDDDNDDDYYYEDVQHANVEDGDEQGDIVEYC